MTENTINAEKTMRGGMSAMLGRIDQYEILRELGEGGFGAVYLARDTVAGVEVAIKGLPPEVKHNRAEMENVKANFALVSRLHHPNIAAALHLHLAKTTEYADKAVRDRLRVLPGDTLLVMEYAPGVTLDRWRKQFPGGIVPLGLAANIAWEVAQALDFAHRNRILHRDVKPANVMIETLADGSTTARLLDFGLAAEIRSSMGRVSREIRDTSGTRPYMAPEQWAGRRQTAATDQYALAAMLYELINGEVPFASVFETGDPVVMMTVVTNRPVEIPPDSLRRRSLAKALSKEGTDRYPSCMEFIQDFAKSERHCAAQAAAEQPTADSRPQAAQPVRRRFDRRYGYLLAAVLVAVLGLTFFVVRQQRAHRLAASRAREAEQRQQVAREEARMRETELKRREEQSLREAEQRKRQEQAAREEEQRKRQELAAREAELKKREELVAREAELQKREAEAAQSLAKAAEATRREEAEAARKRKDAADPQRLTAAAPAKAPVNMRSETQMAKRCAQNADWAGCYEHLVQADTNDCEIMYLMGVCLSSLHPDKRAGVAKNDRRAFNWFLRGAKRGDAPCQQNLGEAYRKGIGISKDVALAGYWIRESADKGNPYAVCSLAQMLENGEGCGKDMEKAADLYALAAQKNVAAAQNWIRDHHDTDRYKRMVARSAKTRPAETRTLPPPSEHKGRSFSRSISSRANRTPRTYGGDWSGSSPSIGGSGGSNAAVWGSVLGGVLTGLAIGLSAIH